MNSRNSVYDSIIGSTADSFIAAIDDGNEEDFMYVSCSSLQASLSNTDSFLNSDSNEENDSKGEHEDQRVYIAIFTKQIKGTREP